MYLVAIAWMYVAVMMAVAEVSHPDGTYLGAFFHLFVVWPVAAESGDVFAGHPAST